MLIACVLLVVTLELANPGLAQQGCAANVPSTNNDPTWAKGKQVTVIFDSASGLTQAQRDAIKQASENWNASNGPPPGNNSGVTFTGFTVGSKPQNVPLVLKTPTTLQFSLMS